MDELTKTEIGNISCYAQGDDYHDVIKKKLKQMARLIAKDFSCDVKVFVDTAPVMEKPLAEKAGLGWQGKHTCIVSRQFGSWLFLGEIFTTLDLLPDEPEKEHCGSCTRCLDICPTQAFTQAGKLDARKCISYLTIEHKGHIDKQYRKAMGNRIYGCDDCLAICPWNSFAKDAKELAYHPREALIAPLLTDLAKLKDAEFRQFFSKSPVKRIGRDRFVRNVLIAIGNSKNPNHIDILEDLLRDEADVVRAMAIWAIGELAEPTQYNRIKQTYMPLEQDNLVASEWH
jgi:epoxyqueuosine reductase